MTRQSPGSPHPGPVNNTSATAKRLDTVTVPPVADIPRQLRGRRSASWRLAALPDGRHDPLHLPDEDLSPGALAAWGLAIDHLLTLGLCPILPPTVRRARAGRR